MYERSKIKKHAKIAIIVFFIILAFVVSPIYKGKNLINYTISSIKAKRLYEELPSQRQENYNKMKIDYVNLKDRLTGTAPFNQEEVSNNDGVDVTDQDDYVRTFDIIKYTLEFGIAANTDEDGVTDGSSFKGGVVKIKAKLPNQGKNVKLTWQEDAWMKNVQLSEDKTEIYAEFHAQEDIDLVNANQSLTFQVLVGGYEEEVTEDMKPEFEIWMEGNEPDDISSSAKSKVTKDNSDIIITGKPSFDLLLGVGQQFYQKGSREINGKMVDGQYIEGALELMLKQDVDQFSDLRGLVYPTGKFTVKLKAKYQYTDDTSIGEFITIDENTPDAIDKINGTKVIEYGANFEKKSNYYPQEGALTYASYGYSSFPYGKLSLGSELNSVQDSGNIELTQNQDEITVTFENYKLNGIFPQYSAASALSRDPTVPQTNGIFAVANMELFAPFYTKVVGEHNYQLHLEIEEAKCTINDEEYVIKKDDKGIFNDVRTGNNSVIKPFKDSLEGNAITIITAKSDSGETLENVSRAGNGSVLNGERFSIQAQVRMNDGPYKGGSDGLITWNPNLFELVSKNNLYIKASASSTIGLTPDPTDQIKMYYGVYKESPSSGTITDSEINKAVYEDFTWYDTYEEALSHGLISSVYINDPQNSGNSQSRVYSIFFKAKDNKDNIGQVGMFRYKARFYEDSDRKKVFYYGGYDKYISDNGYIKTSYDETGAAVNYESSAYIGESVLITGLTSSVQLTTTDKADDEVSKKSYDVQEGEINLNVLPKIEANSESTASKIVEKVRVKVYLPSGLSYKENSANKVPLSVITNTDGTTEIIWEYTNWELNKPAPEYPSITFKAEIQASLSNNQSLEIKSTIETQEDMRDLDNYRTSKYGIVISNLAGSQAIKEISKPLLDRNESFEVKNVITNNGQSKLSDVKSIEVLPKNNDSRGSKFSGSYTIDVKSLQPGQNIYYTTKKVNELNLKTDQYGKLTAKEIDFEHSDSWIKSEEGSTIPSEATLIATTIDEISELSEISFEYVVKPIDNKPQDKYTFTMNVSSDNLVTSIKTNTVFATVAKRIIKGKSFIDVDRNNYYSKEDKLQENIIVNLLDSHKDIVKTTRTDSNGEYEFTNVDKGNYYVSFEILNNYEVIDKIEDSSHITNVFNKDAYTDLISGQNQEPTKEVIEVDNVNFALRQKEAKLIVNYLSREDNSPIIDRDETTVYYGDKYTTTSSEKIPSNYELVDKTDNYEGEVSSDVIEVNYYYEKKNSQIESSISKTGTKEISSIDKPIEYKISYKAKIKDYIGNYTLTLIDNLSHEIDVSKSDLDGGTYDNASKTITWTIKGELNTYEEMDSVNVEKNIRVVYKDIKIEEKQIINHITGNIELDNNSLEKSAFCNTFIKIPSKIIIHHYLKGTTDKIADDVEVAGYVFDEYVSKKVDKEGYKLVSKPESEKHTFKEETQEFIYEYEKISVNVITVVDGIGGEIEGDERVLYGENSTPNKIIIEAFEGYYIKSIKINGKNIKITNDRKVILPNFINMKEDEVIHVTFEKVDMKNSEYKNPNTLDKIHVFILSLIISIAFILGLFKKIKSRI